MFRTPKLLTRVAVAHLIFRIQFPEVIAGHNLDAEILEKIALCGVGIGLNCFTGSQDKDGAYNDSQKKL